jgi:TRAP transporter TAXI family solute receptor
MPPLPHAQPLRRTQRRAQFRRRVRWISIAAAALVLVLSWAIQKAMQPGRQRALVFSAGSPDGIYAAIAHRYADALKRDGIKLDIRPSSGAVENYQRLKDQASAYDIGLVQSGTGTTRDAPNLQTLVSVSYEPIWLFYRGDQSIDRLSQLAGLRVGIGHTGSGLRTVMLAVLALHGVTRTTASIAELPAAAAAAALREGRLDAAAFIGAPDIPLIDALLHSDLKLASMSQANTVVRRFPALTKVTFPRGAIDLARDLPPQDVTLLSTTALLVAKQSLPTELGYALLDAATKVHATPNFFASPGEFPSQKTDDFPISDENRRYFRNGRPFLQNYLPFALANFIEQHFVVLVPSIAVFFALMQMLPRLYAYRMRTRLTRWYHEVKLLEDEVEANRDADPLRYQAWRRELALIDASVNKLAIPEGFIRDVYPLKHAIRMVGSRLRKRTPHADMEEQRSGII